MAVQYGIQGQWSKSVACLPLSQRILPTPDSPASQDESVQPKRWAQAEAETRLRGTDSYIPAIWPADQELKER